jgi:hypothetical protein
VHIALPCSALKSARLHSLHQHAHKANAAPIREQFEAAVDDSHVTFKGTRLFAADAPETAHISCAPLPHPHQQQPVQTFAAHATLFGGDERQTDVEYERNREPQMNGGSDKYKIAMTSEEFSTEPFSQLNY